ncbi:MAG: hypothetical protein HFJ52_02330 [Clostridia bacterium]|nr:hypothetical protein [Clostridia bacterium]
MSEELAYSIHLGSDKNRTTKAKEIAKNNSSGTTSFSNNAIQNATQLSKVNKHNLCNYDNNKELINVIYGTNNLYNDVQQLYLQEFEQARIEYNEKQTRADRKIDNYFKHISNSKLWDLACEFIIELGDMDFWQSKTQKYRYRMVQVYSEQAQDLMKVVPEFKVANAVIHFDETSPHLHLVGLPISDNNKRGMKKQVAKLKIFTKESLKRIQDEMRYCCIKSYNKVYEKSSTLKQKQKGRNQDIHVKDMSDYRQIKREQLQNAKRLEQANNKSKNLDSNANKINTILEELKPSKLNKNNMVISSENVAEIKKLTEEIKDTTQSVRSVNDLNIAIKDFEHTVFDTIREVSSPKSQVRQKDDEISYLKKELSAKDKIIDKLRTEKENLKEQLQKFKGFWHSIMKRFQSKLGFDKNEHYKYVTDDLYNNRVFDKHEKEIATDYSKKVKTLDEINIAKAKRKNDNDFKGV